MRKVTVFSTQTNDKKEIMTAATKWSDLKSQIEEQGLSTEDVKAMVKGDKRTLEHADAELPEGDFTLFLTPSKVKSGDQPC